MEEQPPENTKDGDRGGSEGEPMEVDSPERKDSLGSEEDAMYAEPTEFVDEEPVRAPVRKSVEKQAEPPAEGEAADPMEAVVTLTEALAVQPTNGDVDEPMPDADEEPEQPEADPEEHLPIRNRGGRPAGSGAGAASRGGARRGRGAARGRRRGRGATMLARKRSGAHLVQNDESAEEAVDEPADESADEPAEEGPSSSSAPAKKKPGRKPKQQRKSYAMPPPRSTIKLRRRKHEPPEPKCTFCQIEQKPEDEEFKMCTRCARLYHVKKCLRYKGDVVSIIRATETWFCPSCQFCQACGTLVDDPLNKECALCLGAWHGECAPRGNCPSGVYGAEWFCSVCCMKKGIMTAHIPIFPSQPRVLLPKPTQSPATSKQVEEETSGGPKERLLFDEEKQKKIVDALNKRDALYASLLYQYGFTTKKPLPYIPPKEVEEETEKADEAKDDGKPKGKSGELIEIDDTDGALRDNEGMLKDVNKAGEEQTLKDRCSVAEDSETLQVEDGSEYDSYDDEDDKDVPGPSTRVPKSRSRSTKRAIREAEWEEWEEAYKNVPGPSTSTSTSRSSKQVVREDEEKEGQKEQGSKTLVPYSDPHVNNPLRSKGFDYVPEKGEGYITLKPNKKFMVIGPISEKEKRKIPVSKEYRQYLLQRKVTDARMRMTLSPKDYNYFMSIKEKAYGDDPFIPKYESGVQWVHFGTPHVFRALYDSAYPEPTNSHTHLWVCKFCLFCEHRRADFEIHISEHCKAKFPPGNEIYRREKISFFEVDGRIQTDYCVRLSLLAKLFIGSKTEWRNPQTFVYYVLCELQEDGFVIQGYFSKEKNPAENNNLSCLLVLPTAQRKGYGRMLIDLSYELSRKELRIGHPEHPLSDAGLLAYRGFWRSSILCYLRKISQTANINTITIKDIALATRITENDIVQQLMADRCIVMKDGKFFVKIGKRALKFPLSMIRRRAVNPLDIVWEPSVHSTKNLDPNELNGYDV